MTTARPARRLRVLESFRTPRATTNPYLVLLLRSLAPHVDVRTFSWPAALVGRYDVLHVHWPEVVVERRHPLRAAAAAALFALVLLRCRLTRVAVVRTAHNLAPHEPRSALVRAVLRLCDRSTTLWIRLNPSTPTPPGAAARTVVHGHYRDWFDVDPAAHAPVPGRLTYVGLIRPYKGVEALVEAFAQVDDPDLALRVAGRPHTPALAAEVTAAAAGDPRVTLRLEHLPDDELAREVLDAELVVLPYREMHNSGAALLALSLDRPVLVTDNEVTRALAAEVGERWVQRCAGPLDAAALTRALADVRATPGGRPDLAAREWGPLGRQHAAAFADAVRARRGTGAPEPARPR